MAPCRHASLVDGLRELDTCLYILRSIQLEEAEAAVELAAMEAESAPLEVGTVVFVEEAFTSNDSNVRELNCGERGVIVEVIAGGYARIQFQTDRQWVGRSNFSKLRASMAVRAQDREAVLAAAQRLLQRLGSAMEAAKVACVSLAEERPPSSRMGYLRELEALLPRPPEGKDWLAEELPAMLQESDPTRPELQQEYSLDQYRKTYAGYINQIDRIGGLPREEAELLALLSTNVCQGPLSRALCAGDPSYAGATHALVDMSARRLRAATVAGASAAAPKLYWHLRGAGSLEGADPAWARLEVADATGFCGLVTTALVTCSNHPDWLHGTGFAVCTDEGYVVQDSPVVCFESHAPDLQGGLHSAVMINASSGMFPPHTLFVLKDVIEGEFGAVSRYGRTIKVKQKCLTVTATFHGRHSMGSAGAKIAVCAEALHYSNSVSSWKGFSDILRKPALTMEQEFAREQTWHDWMGRSHTLQECWQYAIGPAIAHESRDANNHGKMVKDFMEETNDLIRRRRQDGYGKAFPEDYAALTEEEVLSLRLFSGPAWQPLNDFLRQISGLHGVFREAVARDPNLTFAASVGHICHAIRKLAAISTPAEVEAPLYVAARGALPRSFLLLEGQDTVCATECAFLSTSRSLQTPVSYLGVGQDILWELQPHMPTDVAFHHGADISSLSQFAHEVEVLFPPCTALLARKVTPQQAHTRSGRISELVGDLDADEKEGDGGKKYITIRVSPQYM